ncbi:MAG TPA: cytochrome c oxidase assembly protein [Azospirillum sp.]|nr:cytochrome c oxidase assembly protein [Azospirillum sp.]
MAGRIARALNAGALCIALLCATLPLAAGPALAHTPGGAGWVVDAWSAGPLALSAALYLAGWQRWQARRAAAFWAGWGCAAAALLSPLYGLAEGSFAAHMVEHELLIAVAAPLLVLARPLGVLLAPLPAGARRTGGWGRLWARASAPVTATALHAAALWLWHLPALFDAALDGRGVHALQHLCLFGTALLFWWAMLVGRGAGARGIAVLCLFVTGLHGVLLGALLTLAPAPIYAYGGGIDALTDQQLAGLIMWVPGAMVYVGAALALLAPVLARTE